MQYPVCINVTHSRGYYHTNCSDSTNLRLLWPHRKWWSGKFYHITRCKVNKIVLSDNNWKNTYFYNLNSSAPTTIHTVFYIIICGSGTDRAMDLCGNTWPPFTYSSSLTITSSPRTVQFSMRTQRPTTERQPTMQPSSHACWRTQAPRRIVLRFMHAPWKISDSWLGLWL